MTGRNANDQSGKPNRVNRPDRVIGNSVTDGIDQIFLSRQCVDSKTKSSGSRSLCKTISIVSLLCFSASLDCIALRIFVNDVYCLEKQASFSCGTVAGHSTAAGPHPNHATIRRITEYSVKLARPCVQNGR